MIFKFLSKNKAVIDYRPVKIYTSSLWLKLSRRILNNEESGLEMSVKLDKGLVMKGAINVHYVVTNT